MCIRDRAYARQAREETRQHEEEARQKVADEAGRQMSELNDYAAKISKMRDDFRALLEELDGRTADVQMQLQEDVYKRQQGYRADRISCPT